jgi:hypothetical protein
MFYPGFSRRCVVAVALLFAPVARAADSASSDTIPIMHVKGTVTGSETVICDFEWGSQFIFRNPFTELEFFGFNGFDDQAVLTLLTPAGANYLQLRSPTDDNSVMIGFQNGYQPYLTTEFPNTDFRLVPQGNLVLEPLQLGKSIQLNGDSAFSSSAKFSYVEGSKVAVFNAQGVLTNSVVSASALDKMSRRRGYITLTIPDACDGQGCKAVTEGAYFARHAEFEQDTGVENNWCWWFTAVPEDLDPSVELRVERFKFALLNTDPFSHRYVISMADIEDSTGANGTFTDPINLDFPGDPAGDPHDIETISMVSLTGWNSKLTPGHGMRVKVARDGYSDQDKSGMPSVLMAVVISYGVRQ